MTDQATTQHEHGSSSQDVVTSVDLGEIVYEVDWSQLNPDGTRKYPDMPEREERIDGEKALAVLLLNDVLSLNSNWFRKDWPAAARETLAVSVVCNDVFAWACADAQDIEYRHLDDLYRMWLRDKDWGPAVWCIIRRRHLPQEPVLQRILRGGKWDMEALTQEHGLRANHYDDATGVVARREYDAYVAWANSEGRQVLPFDAQWWAGWGDYVAAHPAWRSAEWEREDDRLIQELREANGF